MIPAILGLMGQLAGGAMQNQQNQQLNEQNRIHEEKLLGMQHQYNEAEAGEADKRTRNLYNDLQSPAAIKQQLKEAGLSIGLMYGNGGMGGQMQAGAQGAGVTPQNRGTLPMTNVADGLAQQAANTELIEAQRANIEADTKKKEADAANAWRDLPLKDKQLVIMDNQINEIQQNIKESNERINNLVEERKQTIANTDKIKSDKERNEKLNELTQAQKEYTESQNKLLQIQIEFEPERQKAAIAEMRAHAKEMIESAKKLGLEGEILDKTKTDIITQVSYKTAMMLYEKDEIQKAQLDQIKKNIYYLEQQGFKAFNEGESEAQKRRYYDAFGSGAGFVRVLNEDLIPW